MQTRQDEKSSGGAEPKSFGQILEQCETYDPGPEEAETEVAFTGRVLRSPRSGRFFLLVSHRNQNHATALEFDVGAVRRFELLFRDSSGRCTYEVRLSAGCDVNVLQPDFDHLGSFRNASPLTTAAAQNGIQDPMEVWAAAPWRRHVRSTSNPDASADGARPAHWSQQQYGDPQLWNPSAEQTTAYDPSTGYGLADYGAAYSGSQGYPPAGDATLVQPTLGQGPPSHPLERGCGYGTVDPGVTDPVMGYPGHDPWRRY